MKKNYKIDVNNYFDENLFKGQRRIFFSNKCVKSDYFYLNRKGKKIQLSGTLSVRWKTTI